MSDGRQLLSFVCCGTCGAQLDAPHADGCPYRYERIDLAKLEAIARAADKDNPGVCYSADHVDGYPSAQSALDLFNAMDPATTMSLIRRIRELGQIATRALGEWRAWHAEVSTSDTEAWKATDAEIEALIQQVDSGVPRYGRYPAGVDERWDIDRPAEV